LCQTTHLQIYLGKDQLQPEHRMRLERFAAAIALRNLRANPIDLRSLSGGGGKQETTWDYIHPPEEQQAEHGASKKRCRIGESIQIRFFRCAEYSAYSYSNAQLFSDQAFNQREPTMYRVSVETRSCLETIVHFYSYTRRILEP